MKVREYLNVLENLIEITTEDKYDGIICELICLYYVANDVDLCFDYGILTREILAQETEEILIKTPSKYFWEKIDGKNTITFMKFTKEELENLFAYVSHHILDDETELEEYKEQEICN